MPAIENACGIQARADIAASFQRVALEHLEDRVSRAAAWALEDWPGIRHLVVAGGVAANQLLRSKLQVGETASVWSCPRGVYTHYQPHQTFPTFHSHMRHCLPIYKIYSGYRYSFRP